MLRALLAVALLSTTAVAKPTVTDGEFQAAVKQYAQRTHRVVVAWGTLRLDGKEPRRFATLEAATKLPYDETSVQLCAGNHACRGAYVLEQAPDRLWVVGYSDDRWGSTRSFHRPATDPTGDPAWLQLDDTAIEHGQMHNHGTEQLRFGFRGGRLVMLAISDENRHGAGGPDGGTIDLDDRTFVDDAGACKKRCPSLAGFGYRNLDYATLTVTGPVTALDAAREPAVRDE